MAKKRQVEAVRGREVALSEERKGIQRRGRTGSAVLMLLLTAVMLALLFPPFYCLFFAPVALVPLCICVLRRPLSWRYMGLYYLCGVGFFLPNLYWLGPVTVIGYILVSLYLAVYFPLFALGLHRLVNGLRMPAIFAVPLVWVAVEYVRCTFLEGGFPWFILGNSLTPMPVLIQIADLFGVWGVTFFIAMLNGFVVDMLRLPLRREGRFNIRIGRLIAAMAVTILFVIIYGVTRLDQKTTRPGPRVAVIQENIPQSLKMDPGQLEPNFEKHIELTREAAALSPKPALIAWPETMVPAPINPALLALNSEWAKTDGQIYVANGRWCDQQLRELSDSTGCALLVGATGEWRPGVNGAPVTRRNLTVLYEPGAGQVASYAKVHLVPFGEYIPFLHLPLVGKYMAGIGASVGMDDSMVPGTEWTRFNMMQGVYAVKREVPATAQAGTQALPAGANELIQRETRVYRFGTPICFEDTMPEPARRMTAAQYDGGRKADFLINASNDGWFMSAELNEHLQASQLRAVEERVPIARAVNTGNSGFVDSCGRIVKLVTDAQGNSIGAVGVATWTMEVDSRVTLFSRVGDLLPIVCGILAVLGVGWTVVRPRRGKREIAGDERGWGVEVTL